MVLKFMIPCYAILVKSETKKIEEIPPQYQEPVALYLAEQYEKQK